MGGDGINALDLHRMREKVLGLMPAGFDDNRCDVTGDDACTVADTAVIDRILRGGEANLVDGCPAYFTSSP